jgi:hypothetical protein
VPIGIPVPYPGGGGYPCAATIPVEASKRASILLHGCLFILKIISVKFSDILNNYSKSKKRQSIFVILPI